MGDADGGQGMTTHQEDLVIIKNLKKDLLTPEGIQSFEKGRRNFYGVSATLHLRETGMPFSGPAQVILPSIVICFHFPLLLIFPKDEE